MTASHGTRISSRGGSQEGIGHVIWLESVGRLEFLNLLAGKRQLAYKRYRYNFGTTEGEISGEITRKRRSAKHLEFSPALLEGRRSIQLSYGRSRSIDSKPFTLRADAVFTR